MKGLNVSILVIFLIVVLFSVSGAVEITTLLFDEKSKYDIYLSSGETQTVIRSVRILKQIEIGQKTFLVVEPSDFNLTENQGFINLDNVAAILPVMKFRVEAVKRVGLFQ